MKRTRSKLFVPVLAGLIGMGAFAAYKIAESPNVPIVDSAYAASSVVHTATDVKPAPNFTLKDIDGKTISLSDYKGKVVVLNFWATWCAPCRKEIPDFNELQAVYGSQGVQFLGIALDDEGASKVKQFVSANPMKYPVLLPDANLMKSYGEMSAIPVTYVIDRKGMIRQSYVGIRQKSVLEGFIAPLLAEK